MSDTNRTHLSLDQKHRARLVEIAAQESRPMTTVVEDALDRYDQDDCGCEGRGYSGIYHGRFIWCRCRLGLDYAMAEISKEMQILADDLVEMGSGESNKTERALKQFHFDMLKLQHDTLEAEWLRLSG